MTPIPKAIRSEVVERAGGYCEVCSLPGPVHIHHRKLRSQGGRNEAVNLIHIHLDCHEDIHHNPERSYALGHLVHGWADPADVPVVREAS